MGRIPYDDDNYVRPLHGATGNESDLQRAWREQAGEPQGYRIERGLEEESPAAFQRAWRAELREESDLWLLSDKNRIAELEKREKERQAKQQKQHEALLAERREQAERQAAWNRDVFSPEDFSNLTGIDLHWCRVIFKQYIASGLVAPIDEAALTLSRSDVQLIARRSAEDIEFQVLKARNKRAQGGR